MNTKIIVLALLGLTINAVKMGTYNAAELTLSKDNKAAIALELANAKKELKDGDLDHDIKEGDVIEEV